MNKLFAAITLLLLFFSVIISAQTPPLAPGTRTVAAGSSQLPAASSSGALNKVFNVTDSVDCVNVVSGAFKTPCVSNGTIWMPWGIWKASGANAYYNTGNVGIGTTSPQVKEHIVVSGGSGGTSGVGVGADNSTDLVTLRYDTTNKIGHLASFSSGVGSTLELNHFGGTVGIGTGTGLALGNQYLQLGPNWTNSGRYVEPGSAFSVNALEVYGSANHSIQGVQSFITTEGISGAGIGFTSFAFANNSASGGRGAWPWYSEGHRLEENDYAYGFGEVAVVNRVNQVELIDPYNAPANKGTVGLQIDCGGPTTDPQYSCSNGILFVNNQSTATNGFGGGITFRAGSIARGIYDQPHAIELAASIYKHSIVWFGAAATPAWSIYSDGTSGNNSLKFSNTEADITINQNGQSRTFLSNSNSGTTALAEFAASNDGTIDSAMRVLAMGSGWTSVGGFVQRAGVLDADTLLTGGLSIMTRANAPIRFYTNGLTNEWMRLTEIGNLQAPNYASQTTGWSVSYSGSADFRYLYTDELHAKAFIADIEQALAGGQIITKSVAKVAADFTVPSAGGSGTVTVEEFSGSTAHVFVDNDLIQLRQITRGSDTSLTITSAYGTVTYVSRTAANGPTPSFQSYTFARPLSNGGSATGTINAGTLALDFGTSANKWGYWEVNAVDGANAANSPYAQIVTSSGTGGPAVQSNRTVRTRVGNLNGVSGVSEYGFYAGNVVDGTTLASTHRYIRLTDSNFELNNLDLNIYNSGNKVIAMDYATPYFSLGATAPTSYLQTSSNGIWMGNGGSSVYKMRVGAVSSGGALTQGFTWDGTTFTIIGGITATSGSIGGWSIGSTAISSTGVTMTSGSSASIAFGATVPTGPTTGTGIYQDKTGLYGLVSNTSRFMLDATDGTLKLYVPTGGNGNDILQFNNLTGSKPTSTTRAAIGMDVDLSVPLSTYFKVTGDFEIRKASDSTVWLTVTGSNLTTPGAITAGSGAIALTNSTGNILPAAINGYPSDATKFLNGNGAWTVPAGASSPLTTKGDIWVYSTVNTRLPVGTNGQVLSADSTQTTGLKWIANSATLAIGSSITSGTSGSVLYVNSSNALAQDNANFFWDATNHRLGLGTTTPSTTLDVRGNVSLQDNAALGWGTSLTEYLGGDNTNHALLFGTNSLEKVRITSAGNVGIGTTSPVSLLDVRGSLYVNGGSPPGSFAGKLYVTQALGSISVSDYSSNGVLFSNTAGNNSPILTVSNDHATTGNANIYFGINGVPKGVLGYVRSSSAFGFVNFGYSSADFMVLFKGDGSFFFQDAATSTERFKITAAGGISTNSTAGVSAGSFSAITAITSTNGIVTQLTGTSDERLKERIKPFERGLTDLEKIVPIRYYWNETGRTVVHSEKEWFGFSAQNIQGAIPEAIGTEKWADGSEWMTINDRVILGTAVNAIKELKERIEVLENQKPTWQRCALPSQINLRRN